MTRQHAIPDPSPRRTTIARSVGVGATIAAVLAAGTVFASPAAADPGPDFGPNVIIFDPSDSVEHINDTLASISDEAEFSLNRHAVFFKPGTYGSASGQNDPTTATGIVNGELGYYTSVSGLGASPEDVRLNGAIHVEPVRQCEANPWDCPQPGSLTRFWRSLSNMTINPIQQPVGVDALRPFPNGVADKHQMRFAVSQAAPLRRMNIEGGLTLFGRVGEFASGGYLANSRVTGTLVSGSQQQWFTRNSEVGTWDGGVWNTVFSGVQGAPATDFAPGNKTTIAETPVSREAPFLYLDGDDYKVFVPSAETNSSGVNWGTSASDGEAIGIDDFFIAHEGDSAATINAALATGKNLLLTPGVYELAEPISVTRPDTVVLGLGYASLTPTAGTSALEVADVPGVVVSGITVDAGTTESATLVKIGSDGHTGDAANPTTLSDVFIRIGGAWAGKAETSIEVNSDDVLLDHIWAWRADHGVDGAFGWDVNTGAHGVVVNGDDVTATGLFVEHYQENQTVWNGERGRTIFYQSELPYDPPSQAAWMDGDRNGYASYRVADTVRVHNATGLGNYSFFERGIPILAESGIQAPRSRQITFQSMTSVFLNGSGGISRIINDAGAPAVGTFSSPQLASYPPVDTTAPTVTITADATDVDGWYPAVALTIVATDDFTPPPTIETKIDGGPWTVAAGNSDSAPGSISVSVPITDGQHTVIARATDDSGNVSSEASWSGKVHAGPPAISFGGGKLTPGQSVTLTGEGIPAGSYDVVFRSDPVVVASTEVDNETRRFSATFTVPTSADPGAHRIELTDANGAVIAAADVTVVAAAGPGGSGGGTGGGNGAGAGASGASGAGLASTGFEGLSPMLGAALLLLLIGAGVLLLRRRSAGGSAGASAGAAGAGAAVGALTTADGPTGLNGTSTPE
ncbi:hypothetical protein [Plantibacter sp. YIM 135249]|uniref:hypothetical protein n=1 Tax=Plantibacter sp. YIM 135249 TaxID=3423918 RepID=UPI003D343DE9